MWMILECLMLSTVTKAPAIHGSPLNNDAESAQLLIGQYEQWLGSDIGWEVMVLG
jgi:hypothetical protein